MSLTIDLCGRNLINMDFSDDAGKKNKANDDSKWGSAKLVGADLRGVNFSHLDMNHASFRGADLRGAFCEHTNFYGADFRGADLRGAYFKESNFDYAWFMGADLKGADLRAINVTTETRFAGADLRGVIINPKEFDFIIGKKYFVGAITSAFGSN